MDSDNKRNVNPAQKSDEDVRKKYDSDKAKEAVKDAGTAQQQAGDPPAATPVTAGKE
jgi:hypothetical protein